MSKQIKKKKEVHQQIIIKKQSFFDMFWVQAISLIFIGFIFYANSFKNEYALDDGIVIQKNDYVQQGIKGIPKILKTDAYDSFYRQMGAKQQLSGGRYRPLSVVTFAVEQQLFGSKEKVKPDTDIATIRHIMNVVFYILSVVLLLYLLKMFVFKATPLVAFITCLIFLIHPIHTEVIANVKSRDEILSFLFIVLTFIFAMRYRETKNIGQLILALVMYFLALLSKEYAVTLLILLPMLFYIVNKESFDKVIIGVLPYAAIFIIYYCIRYSIVKNGATDENPDVLNSPFMYATTPEKWATKIEILNHYLRLLFFPHPLSSDYSYNTIPYTNFANPMVWFSIVFHLSAIAGTIYLFVKRNIIAFALAFYLLHLALVSNLFFNLGATMGERLIYHSSFGFAIIIAIAINWLANKIPMLVVKKGIVILFLCLITYSSFAIVFPRNQQWKNDVTLFINDAEIVPNSALVNGNAGKDYIDLSEKPENKSKETELVKKGIQHLKEAVAIHTKYVNGYLNLGVGYYKLKQYDSAKVEWDMVKTIFPNHPLLKRNYGLLAAIYFDKGMTIGATNPKEAITYLEKAVEISPNNADYWYNLGGACFTVKEYAKARAAWTRCREINPNNVQAQQGLMAIPHN
jgi:protein O-mannosyl-transferase